MTQAVQILKDALLANERAFRNKHTGEVQYVLDGEVDASVWDDVMIIPNLSNEVVDTILSAEGLVQTGERSQPDSFLEAEAHELWALAQVPPGGGIEDAVERIKGFLANMKVTVVGDLPEGWEAVTAGADEALTDDANERLRVGVRRVLPPFSGTSGARAWSAPTLSEAIAQACEDLGLKRPKEAEYVEELKADLGSLSAEANRSANEIVSLHEKVSELERLCDATYVAKGADAYHHACAEMERWQEGRKLQDKDPGTEGSLCDGISWLQERIEELEAQVKESYGK